MMTLSRHRSQASAFTLVETLIATAIIAISATSIYYAFLRMNDNAVAARCDTTAKLILERAVNLAVTSEWGEAGAPPILALTGNDFVTFDLTTGADSDGSVSLFDDPNNNTIVTGTLSRQVLVYSASDGSAGMTALPLGDVRQATFKLTYKVHKRAMDPVTEAKVYILRASDK